MKRVHMKLLGLLLAVILIVSLLPFGALTALAEEPEGAITALGLSLAQPEPGPYGPAQVQIVSGGSVSGSVRELAANLHMTAAQVQYDRMLVPAVLRLAGVTVTGIAD